MSTLAPERPDVDRASADDVLFVGAGASTSYVLLSLLTGLRRTPPPRSVRIRVVEQAPDPFSGVPYGGRAARTALLITSLHDFLPDDERRLFSDWLSENKDWVFDEFLAATGPVSARWWARHREDVARDEFDALFLPRYVFGIYLVQRTRRAIDEATAAGVVSVEVVQDEVLSVAADDSSYVVRCRESTARARRVVLATGSSPILPRLRADSDAAGLLVDDPYAGMDAALQRVDDALRRTEPGEAPHVVLIGGNASTMDLLYQLGDLPVVDERQVGFTVLSPRGQLPERMGTPRTAGFSPERLNRLAGATEVDAAAIYEAALEDIASGRAAGLSVADTLRPISEAVGRLVSRLSADGAAEFAGRWGVELGRHQRRAGWEYCEVVDQLTAQGQLQLVAGAFVDVDSAGARGFHVRYEHAGSLRELDRPATVVINCGGPAGRLQDSGSLAARLIASGVCRATPFGGGIAVDAALAAKPGFYVMGPLMAGNVVKGTPVWHMEHCGRISAFGSTLGHQLAEALTAGTE